MVGNFLCNGIVPDLPHHQWPDVVGLSELVETTKAVMEASYQHLGLHSQKVFRKYMVIWSKPQFTGDDVRCHALGSVRMNRRR